MCVFENIKLFPFFLLNPCLYLCFFVFVLAASVTFLHSRALAERDGYEVCVCVCGLFFAVFGNVMFSVAVSILYVHVCVHVVMYGV